MKRYLATTLLVASPLGLLIATACSGAPSPRSGDHWHASYTINICDHDEDPLPEFDGGVHTSGDGVIHIHPTELSERWENATLVQLFENAGGHLTELSLRLPGDRPWQKGNVCPDGRPGRVVVEVNGRPLGKELDTYVPRDGDRILIAFVPSGSLIPPPPPAPAATID